MITSSTAVQKSTWETFSQQLYNRKSRLFLHRDRTTVTELTAVRWLLIFAQRGTSVLHILWNVVLFCVIIVDFLSYIYFITFVSVKCICWALFRIAYMNVTWIFVVSNLTRRPTKVSGRGSQTFVVCSNTIGLVRHSSNSPTQTTTVMSNALPIVWLRRVLLLVFVAGLHAAATYTNYYVGCDDANGGDCRG